MVQDTSAVPRAGPTVGGKQRRTKGQYKKALLVGCLLACSASLPRACVSQGRICSDKCACRLAEIEVADPTSYLTSPSAGPIALGARQVSRWKSWAPDRLAGGSPNFEVTSMTRPGRICTARTRIDPRSATHKADAFATGPRRRCSVGNRAPHHGEV